MQKDAHYHQEYTDFVNRMITRGHADKVPVDEQTLLLERLGIFHITLSGIRLKKACASSLIVVLATDPLL